MVGNDENRGTSRRPGADDQRWSHRSGTRWSDDRGGGSSDVMYDLQHARKDDKREFIG
jgi:hypothetical protein